jgi:hypothetical protein
MSTSSACAAMDRRSSRSPSQTVPPVSAAIMASTADPLWASPRAAAIRHVDRHRPGRARSPIHLAAPTLTLRQAPRARFSTSGSCSGAGGERTSPQRASGNGSAILQTAVRLRKRQSSRAVS